MKVDSNFLIELKTATLFDTDRVILLSFAVFFKPSPLLLCVKILLVYTNRLMAFFISINVAALEKLQKKT